jgi:hypothetical protein
MCFPEVEAYFTTDMAVYPKSSSKPFSFQASKSAHGASFFLLLDLVMFSCEHSIVIAQI